MNRKFFIPAIVCLIICILCLLLYFDPFLFQRKPDNTESPVHSDENDITTDDTAPITDDPGGKRDDETKNPVADTAPDTDDAETEENIPYKSPIDFGELHAINPDIYAWISIDGTDISYPIVQSEDDTFYIRRNIYGESETCGSLFTESTYNGKQFDDGITVIYGHRMRSGTMFGTLQMVYSSKQALRDHMITIYMPEGEIHYLVFAAVPYDKRHIMYNYGGGSARGVKSFLKSVSEVKSLDAYRNEDDFGTSGDKLIVLSTCLYGDKTKRFIVVGKQI